MKSTKTSLERAEYEMTNLAKMINHNNEMEIESVKRRWQDSNY